MIVSDKAEPRSIRATLASWISVSLLAVGILMVLANNHALYNPIKRQLDQLANDVAAEMVDHLAEDVWNMDNHAIQQYFVGYPWASLGLVSVRVTTQFDDVLFQHKYSTEVSPISCKAAVVRDDKPVGYVEVCLSGNRIDESRRLVGHSTLLIIAISILVIVLTCTMIVNAIVVRPVKKTVSGLRMIAGGDYRHQLPFAGVSEINSINQEINAMAAEIFKRQKQLKAAVVTRETAEQNLRELNTDLERRIKDRTEQLRRLAKLLASAQEYEQKRIAEGLHDDVAQLLAASRMKMAVAVARSESDDCKKAMADVDQLVKQAYERLRLLSFELASSTLYQWGLKDSLLKLSSGMNGRYDASFEVVGGDGLELLDDMNATVLFKGARELLFNVIKHSGVKSATIRISRSDGLVTVTVEDKGRGFDANIDIGVGSGLGLFSVSERLHDIGGELQIKSEPGVGTRMTISVPWIEKEAVT